MDRGAWWATVHGVTILYYLTILLYLLFSMYLLSIIIFTSGIIFIILFKYIYYYPISIFLLPSFDLPSDCEQCLRIIFNLY